jgi:hypothetical protein
MALKELESPFNGIDKASVQEWLVHPVTQRIEELNTKAVALEKRKIVDMVMLCGAEQPLGLNSLRMALLEKEAIGALLDGAKDYAK